MTRVTQFIKNLLPALLILGVLILSPGCGEPEPGGPGRTVGSRAGLSSTGELPPPRVEFGDTGYDFGNIELNQQVSHHFSFRNTGESLLFILKVRPS